MLKINIPAAAKSFVASKEIATNSSQDILFLTSSEEAALYAFAQCSFFSDKKVEYLPSFDSMPYDVVSPCADILAKRAQVLTRLATGKSKEAKILITNAINLIVKLAPVEILQVNSLHIYKDLQITPQRLAQFLSCNGFIRSGSAIDSGEFAIKGEIVDIVLTSNNGYRITFNCNVIESIKEYDPATQLSQKTVDNLTITPASEVILNQETITNFKNNYIQNFGVNHTKIPFFDAIAEGRKYPGHEHLYPIFYQQTCRLVEYLNNPIIIYDELCMQGILEHQNSFTDFYQARVGANKIYPENFYPALVPELFILNNEQINELLRQDNNILITNLGDDKKEIISCNNLKDNWVEYINEHKSSKIIIIFCHSTTGLEHIKNLLKNEEYQSVLIDGLTGAKQGVINLAQNIRLDASFYTEKYLFIAQKDIIGNKEQIANSGSSQKRLRNILMELEGLQEKEHVVHKEHGIGQFLGIETIEVQSIPHDCLKILYADDAKLYVPVENIDSIKKYGNFEVALDRLGSVAWQKRKATLKKRVSDIAHKLLSLTAQRKLLTTTAIAIDYDNYEKFCKNFYYVETTDQLKAIEDITADLTSGILMDRLICGDVGFGKTEVALRAAFLIAMDPGYISSKTLEHYNEKRSQVAIIVPTTILCKQHYSRFIERFREFDVKIAQLSRLVSTSEVKKIKEQIKTGEINIIIGTHALLSQGIEFANLKLLIIDEEQHFGVVQKEKLKQLSPMVHVLALSATPIPRTLQMSMVGLKDLSLIATPPVDRLAIRTSIMPFDSVIIKEALRKEHERGGKSFYVAPRISDLTDVEKRLNKLVPELTYKIVHGGLTPVVIDKIMQEFDEGKFDILVSTSIIESGIDIPSTNTMIIHKADQFGLAQIYQLRGRIGRGKIRGYAYLTLENKKTTPAALKKLEIMQTIDTLGAGFTIASHDMDFRGFGNLVGEEQSGHIKEVGVELYQDMLNEQIALLNNNANTEQKNETVTPNINLGLPIFISKEYIADSNTRLGIYRRIGELNNQLEIENFKAEMIDRFGAIPAEFFNLLEIVKIKQLCIKLNIISLDAAQGGWIIKFNPHSNMHDTIMHFVKKFPTHAKIKPDNKLVFVKELEKLNIIEQTFWLCEQLSDG